MNVDLQQPSPEALHGYTVYCYVLQLAFTLDRSSSVSLYSVRLHCCSLVTALPER